MSAVLFLLFYNFTLLLFHSTYSTAAMFGVGGSRCKQVLASRAATFRCRPRTTYYHVIPRTTTYCHPRTIVQAERSFCISGSQPQTSAAKFLHLGQPSPACRPAFLHVGRTHPLDGLISCRRCDFPCYFRVVASTLPSMQHKMCCLCLSSCASRSNGSSMSSSETL